MWLNHTVSGQVAVFPLFYLVCGPASVFKKGVLSVYRCWCGALDTVIGKVGDPGSGPPLLCDADLSREHRCEVDIGIWLWFSATG